MSEYARPWKLTTPALGFALLIAGSRYYPTPDQDIHISLIMAILAYLAAPWSLRELIQSMGQGPGTCETPKHHSTSAVRSNPTPLAGFAR